MSQVYRASLAVLIVFVATSPSAWAHALGVDCHLRGGKVWVEAFYDDDSPAEKAKVEVRGQNDQVVAMGVTDTKGQWSFAAPGPGTYVVHVDAGAGHRAKKSIVVPPAAVQPDAKGTVEPTSQPLDSIAPTREDFTSMPWVRIAIGFGVIGAGSVAVVMGMRFSKSKKRPVESDHVS